MNVDTLKYRSSSRPRPLPCPRISYGFRNIGIRLVKNLASRTVYQYKMDPNCILIELSNVSNP